MTISLQDEVIVITGGAVRLGRAIALECAQSGAKIAITYNHSADEAAGTLEDLNQINPDCAAAFQTELTDTKVLSRLPGKVLSHFGKVTALINNAAIFRRTPLEETSAADWEAAFDAHINTNLKAPYLLARYFGDIFLQQKRGHIVNIADIHAWRPLKNYVPYGISKAGVVALTQSLSKTLAPHVRVNCIAPGTILLPSETQGEADDETSLRERIPLRRLGTPEEIAQSVAFLLGGPGFITGHILSVDGGEQWTIGN
jgi:NAD(P)-dependent dehydrogenase (short-subunit alcohol dehydrogenase family)